jgi:hypothetical protein
MHLVAIFTWHGTFKEFLEDPSLFNRRTPLHLANTTSSDGSGTFFIEEGTLPEAFGSTGQRPVMVT